MSCENHDQTGLATSLLALIKNKERLLLVCLKNSQRNARGFTLVEIMIVVAIIALLAAIAVPGFLRARKRSQASKVHQRSSPDRFCDGSIRDRNNEEDRRPGRRRRLDQVCEERHRSLRDRQPICSVTPTATRRWTRSRGVSDSTLSALSDVTDDAFWSPLQLRRLRRLTMKSVLSATEGRSLVFFQQ